MKILTKRITAMAASLMMMGTMVMGASAVDGTVSNKYNKLYYSGSLTTNNYYVTYSKGTNLTSKSRYLFVSSIIMKKSGNSYPILTENHSEGVAKSNTSRSCYANIGASNVARSYHRSILKRSTSPTDSVLDTRYKNIYY